MSAGWTLDAVCLQIVDCEHKTAPIDESGAYFAVGTPAMRDGVIDYSQARRISRDTFEKWTHRMRPEVGDLLFAREAPVGPIVRIPREENVAPGQRTVLLRPDSSRVSSDFLFYLLSSPLQQRRLQERAYGSTVPHLNVADVRAFQLPQLPGLPAQQAIAEILGALDNKIAANRKLARVADALAHAIFRTIAHGASDRAVAYGDIANVGGGGTPKTSVPEYWGGSIPWATPTDVTALDVPSLGETARSITEQGLANSSANLYPAGSILMTSRATIGAFAIAERPLAVNQGFIVVNAKDPVFQWWLYHDMRSRVDEFVAHANGATFLELPRGRFKTLTVHVPEVAVIEEFSAQAAGLHEVASAASGETRTLATLRDTLLPRLMSGELRVKDAEAVVADAV
ncbi:restriction endonuclease subunit S [Rhodococcus sp. DMF-1]|uniref:restriction endonuclease subunit S n=1 Tax=Rhodococcus TaxID=1827 RepID=UPI000B285B8D|nr:MULTISPECIES: restriction endonuclease subunit S [Rhodococcus]UIR35513.1 restriction endonuclease subunit S [Rhodococcus sp. DMF-1]WKK10504.1 restriction endonuclease subunit S [Rhodococcus ruber]